MKAGPGSLSFARVGKWVAVTVLGVLVGTALALGIALALATTSWGGEQIRRRVLPRVNATLAGRLDLDALHFSGDRLVLERVSLRAPDGEAVARIERVEVAFSPAALLRRELHLRAVTLAQPELGLRIDDDGSNLARALEPRPPAPAPPQPPARAADGKGFTLVLDTLVIRDGTLEMSDTRSATAPSLAHFRLAGVSVQGAGRFTSPSQTFTVHVDARGDATAPWSSAVSIRLEAKGRMGAAGAEGAEGGARGPAGDGALDLAIGDSTLHVSGELASAGPARGAGRAQGGPIGAGAGGSAVRATAVARLHATPALVRWLAPAAALKVPVTLSGHGTWAGDANELSAALELAAGGATASVTASVDVAPPAPALRGLTIRARDVDLGRLWVGGPPSHLDLDLDAHGSGHDLETLRGALTLNVPAGRMGGYALGPVRLRADADRGRFKVMDLLAVLPGARISGAGEATARTVALRAAIDLRDLGATVRSLTAGARPGKAPRAAGHGRVDLVASGDLRAPTLRVRGRLADLAFADVRIPALRLEAEVPDVRVPLGARASLKIPEVSVGARRLRGFLLSLRGAGPRFDARLSLAAPERVRLTVAGTWRANRTELGVDTLTLGLPGATWALAGPMRLAFGGGITRVSGMDWRDGGAGRLRVDLMASPRALRADVSLSELDLTKLPRSLLPPNLGLAGHLAAELHATGHPARPKVEAHIALSDGEVGGLRELSLRGEARVGAGRAAGQVDLGVLGAKLAGTFDVPLSWPPPDAADVAADINLSNLDIERVTSALRGVMDALPGRPAPPPPAAALPPAAPAAPAPPAALAGTLVRPRPRQPGYGGVVSGNLALSGNGARPRLATHIEVRRLVVNGIAAPDVKLAVEGAGRDSITLRLDLLPSRALPGVGGVEVGKPSFVALRTGFSLAALAHHLPSTEAFLGTPLHVEARIDAARLGPLAALVPASEARLPHPVGGVASLDATLDGPPRALRGTLTVEAQGVSSGRFPATDAAFHLELGAREMRANARVTRQGVSLFSLDARVGAPVALLRSPSALASVPIEAHAVLGPLDIQRLGLPAATDRQPARVLTGRLAAHADLAGTLHAPRLAVGADVTDLRLDKTAIGSGHAMLTGRDGKVSADVTLVSGNGGRIHLVAASRLDLGYPEILRGLDPRQLAITGRFDAKGFDVSGLSGSTPGLRSVGGQLFAGLALTGTAADPRVTGRLEWKDGELTVTGMGSYKQVHLLIHGENEHIVLDELRADSGGGRARVTGSGDHATDGGYAIKTVTDLHEFPAYVEGQALATLSLKASSEAKVSVQRVRAKVSIQSARLALSDAKRKHLQPLSQPDDVILVDGNAALNGAQARKLAAVGATLSRVTGDVAANDAAAKAAARRPHASAPAGVIILVNAPRNLWVSGMDANLELGLEPGFRIEVADGARVFGQVTIKRGRADVVGRRFDLKADSSLRFAGPPDAPELDVSANHVNEQEKITVLVNVKGTPGHLQIRITAPDRPDLTETQLYTLIVTGHLDLGGGTPSSTTPTERAASLVGGLVAAQLQKNLAKKLPFDVLTIETGNGLGTARLEAGTYVTSALYVGYVGRLGADPALLQNRNAVHLEYELGARWSFQGEYGDAKTGSADVIWTKRY